MNKSGVVVWAVIYNAFGQAQILVEDVENNLRFPGQYYDAESGLHYNLNRSYDPESARYTQTDPIGFRGEDVNLYAYVGNNPLAFGDPWGLIRRGGIAPVFDDRGELGTDYPPQYTGIHPQFFYCGWKDLWKHKTQTEDHNTGANSPCLLCWNFSCPEDRPEVNDVEVVNACQSNQGPFPMIKPSTWGQPVCDWQTRPPQIYVPDAGVDYCIAVTTGATATNPLPLLGSCIQLTYTCSQ